MNTKVAEVRSDLGKETGDVPGSLLLYQIGKEPDRVPGIPVCTAWP